MLAVRSAFSYNSSIHFAHSLSNVHTWAIFFLRHLANMSCMVPFWAPTGSGFVPFGGARVRSHAVRRRLFIVLMTAAHISPNVFSLRNFLSNIHDLFLTVLANHTYWLYITFIRTFTSFILHVLFTHSLRRVFIAGWLPSAPCVRYNPNLSETKLSDTNLSDIWLVRYRTNQIPYL